MLYSIQFLRGIAAIMVVMEHAAFKAKQNNIISLEWFHVGYTGVDLFFIISGFIMCYTTHNRTISTVSFLKNRIERIIPLYWLLSILALAIFIMYPHLVNSSGGYTGILESFFLIPNGSKFLIQNGWTLSYEFYFYIIFSIFLFFNFKENLKNIGISTTLAILVIIGVIINPKTPYLSFLTSGMLLEFLFGIAAFIIISRYSFSTYINLISIVIGIAILTYFNINGFPEIILSRPLTIGIPMFFIFIGFLGLEKYFVSSKNMFLDLVEKLGNSSYSLYLIHPFVLSLSAIILKKLHISNSYFFSTFLIFGSVVAGFITYNIIEKPITRIIKNRQIKI